MEHDIEKILDAFEQQVSHYAQTALTPSQKTVLAACLQNSRITYQDMAAATDYSANSLRDAGSKLFKQIKAVTGRTVKKSTCTQIIKEWYAQQVTLEQNHLFGREADLQHLLEGIRIEGRRLLCVSGPPRIGKTYLVQRLCQQITRVNAFETAIWCQATHLPTVELLYQYVLTHLGESPLPGTLPAVASLTYLLETRQLLLIIEKTEALHESEAVGGQFRSQSAGYEHWLRSLLDNQNLRSGVILVCRVPPQCLQRSHDMLLLHPLRELSARAAEDLLRHEGLQTYATQPLQQLAQFCGYNPGVLVAATHKIVHSGTQDLMHFIRYPLLTPHADDPIWQAFLDDLTPREYEMLGWLLVYPDVLVQQQGNSVNINGRYSKSLLPVLRSLYNRGLATVDPTGAYCISTEWLRHVTARHQLQRLAVAFCQTDIDAFNKQPFVVPQAPFWRRQWLQQHLLEPLGEQLEHLDEHAWTSQHRIHKINTMLAQLRTQPGQQPGYGVGNFLNLAVALKLPLEQLQITGLTIQYADLWAAPQAMDLTGCQLQHTILPVDLRGELVTAIAPNSQIIAVGDKIGQVLCWQRHGESFEFYRYTQITNGEGHPQPVSHLAFGEDDILAIVAGSTVYSWWLGEFETSPKDLMSVNSPVTSLTCNSDEWVAVGLQDGRIAVWYDSLGHAFELQCHVERVQEVVADPEKYSPLLLSRGLGDRFLVWDISQPDAGPQEIRPERHIFFRLAWQSGQPVSAAYVGNQLLLRMAEGTTSPLSFNDAISLFRFSQQGHYLAALKGSEIEIRRLTDLEQGASLPYDGLLTSMSISNEGRWLLTVGQETPDRPHTAKIWDISTQQVCWQLTANQVGAISPNIRLTMKLQHCQGLSTVEQTYWQNRGVTF